jgi:predicted dehydrogenase
MKFGTAVVGLGVGEAHARAYAALPDCQLRWVADLDASRAERLAGELGCKATTNFETVLDDPQVAIVSIASYDDAHAGQVMSALRSGKDVFAEKPIARTDRELADIKALWLQSGRHLASNLILRAAPLYRQLRDTISGGELGEIYAIDGDYLYGRIEKITDGWRAGVDAYSVMEGGGIHLVDLLMWLTGQRPVRVSSVGNRIATSGTAFRYRDFQATTFEFASGLIGRITANFGCVHRHQHVLRVFGTRGTFIYDDRGARLHRSRDPQTPAVSLEAAPLVADKGALLPDFVRTVRTGRRDEAETQLHLDVLSACAAADHAADTAASLEIHYV